MNLFQTKIRYLGHEIESVLPIQQLIELSNKFHDELKDKTQLQRFIESLNYMYEFYEDFAKDCKLFQQKLKKTPPPWSDAHTNYKIKNKIYFLLKFA